MVQGPLQDVRGEVVARGENLVLCAQPQAGVDEPGGAARGRTDVVQMELEQPGLLVRGGQPDGQRVERIVAGVWVTAQ